MLEQATATVLPQVEDIRTATSELVESGAYNTEIYELPGTDWLLKIADFIDWILRPIWKATNSIYAISPVLYYLFIAVLVIALIGFLWHIFHSFKIAFAKKTFTVYTGKQSAKPLTADDYTKQAKSCAEKGDYLTAMRFIFRSCLLKLEKERFRPAITNREYIRRYKSTPACEPLKIIVNIIDYKWYGDKECSKNDWEEVKSAAKAIFSYTSNQNKQQNGNG